MIPRPYIAQWRAIAPWKQFSQVEQDLVISRTLVEIFSDDYLKQHLAFRGGTALHKLYLHPAPRYSEDIDLVQIKAGPIKPILQRINEVITFFDKKRNTDIRVHSTRANYRFTSEYENIRLRLKLEINTMEHFQVLPWVSFPFEVNNGWYSGKSEITTYSINELLGTKLRALYQRTKGRDLFDLYYAHQHTPLDYREIIQCFQSYMKFVVDRPPTQKQFLINLEGKEKDLDFIGDMEGLLRDEIEYKHVDAFDWIRKELIVRLN